MSYGLYINFPFCKSKCSYCDYITVPDYNGYSDIYLNALIKEMQLYSGNKLKSVYLGGGTPSLMPASQLEKLINALHTNFKISKKIEFTIEVNPDDVDNQLLKYYKNFGVNRISLGIQSFDDEILKFLKRRYNGKTAEKAINLAASFFENYNVDILFAVPQVQSLKKLENDVMLALKYKPKHFAIYDLVIEEKTYLGWLLKKLQIRAVEDDDYVEYYELVYNLLTASDYYHYEISSYALSGFECKHNKLYWRNYEYIGIGAAAHSYINKKRFWNYKFPRQYINAVLDKNNAEESFEILDDDRRLGETIMLNLHLAEGVNIKEINKKYQIDFLKKFRKQIEKLINQELIEVNNNNMKLTFKGRLFANIAASEFL